VSVGGISAGAVGAGSADALAASAATDVAAGGAATLGSVAAPATVSVAGAGGIAGTGITAGEVAAAATGASAIYSMSQQGRSGANVPPMPGQVQNDQQIQATEQQTLAREQAAGGLQSTTGTAGGQQGAVLSPATTSNRSILGG
jgi:hypothetical protein